MSSFPEFRPSAIVTAARRLKLNPMPETHVLYRWRARCPGWGRHGLAIDARLERFHCDVCG